MIFHTHTLPNGLRVICAPSSSDVVYCGVVVDAGTRDEVSGESGMAHFIEHMSFKGTERRSSMNIINRLDSVGGDLNAYTGKEETVYYCAIAKEHAARAIELLLDITLNSTYPQEEMDKEVEVVCDEIESYNDSPAELIFDEFEQLIFDGHPLGRNILGDADRLRALRSSDLQAFAHRLYRTDRMVLYVYGDVPVQKILTLAETACASGASPCDLQRLAPETAYHAQTITKKKDTHQAHVMLGTRAFSATDPRHLHLYLLNNILGGPAMNSRFNLALRERRGLVYTVESNQTCYTDTGIWSVYFGCDASDVKRCLRLVHSELKRLTSRPLSAAALKAAKRQLKGQICLSFDNAENVALGMGKRFLHYGTTLTCLQLCDRIDALQADDLWHTAQEVFAPERITTLIYK